MPNNNVNSDKSKSSSSLPYVYKGTSFPSASAALDYYIETWESAYGPIAVGRPRLPADSPFVRIIALVSQVQAQAQQQRAESASAYESVDQSNKVIQGLLEDLAVSPGEHGASLPTDSWRSLSTDTLLSIDPMALCQLRSPSRSRRRPTAARHRRHSRGGRK